MNHTKEKQDLLDESYHTLFEINRYFLGALRIPSEDTFKKIDEHYNSAMQKPAKFNFEEDKIWKQCIADELSSNYFLSIVYLYFIYKIFNERLGGYTKQVKNLAQKIFSFASKIPDKIISDLSNKYYWLPGDAEKIKNNITFIIDNYNLFINHTSNYEMNRFGVFSILRNYCKYSSKKQDFYKRINDAIIFNKNAGIWLNTLCLSAHIHFCNTLVPIEKHSSSYDNIKKSHARNRVYRIEKSVLSLAEQILDCKKLEHFDSYARMSLGKESSDSFEKQNENLLKFLLSLDNHILEKWPCISFLLYKAIGKMPYHKCKVFFTENTPSSEEKDKSVINFEFRLQEFKNYTSTGLKGEWAQIRIQKMMFFAIANFSSDEDAIKEALDNDAWHKPEKQKELLNDILSENKIPSINNSFDILLWNDDAFSATETALNLLYNSIHYNESKFSSGIIQQINFIDEQRSRLFHYQDVKPTDRPIERDKPKSNADKPRYFNQFCQQSRDNLETEIKTMSKIDCGFQLPIQAHILPTYNQKTFVRQQNCKLFLETDTACNLPQEDFFRNRYMNMLHTRYIYPARNMLTHYSKYNPTENLLDERNFDNLILLEYDIMTRLQKERRLLELKKDLDDYSISTHFRNSGFVCLRNPYRLREILSAIVNSPEYNGNLKKDDIRRIEDIESSKKILEILYEVQKNYPKKDENESKLLNYIQYIKTHHRDAYCLIKDIINQKKYSGNINNGLLEEMADSCHPSLRIYQFYYTLSDIRNDYHANDALANELDEKIAYYKEYTFIIPQENTEQLLKSFKEIEVFFIKNKDAYVEAVNDTLKHNDFKNAYDYTCFLWQYLDVKEIFDQEICNTFWKAHFCLFEESKNSQGKVISEDAKKIILNAIEIVFAKLEEFPLTKNLESCINSNNAKDIIIFIHQILKVHGYFGLSTKLHLAETADSIRSQIILYHLKIIKKTADQIKEILSSFNATVEELSLYESSKLQEFIDQKDFTSFIENENQMMQDINKYILFRYSTDNYSDDDSWHNLFNDEESPTTYIKQIAGDRVRMLQKYIQDVQINRLNILLKHIENSDLPIIQVDQNRFKLYKNYLLFLEKLDNECKDIQCEETHSLIGKIQRKVAKIRKEFSTPFHRASAKVFENEKIYKSFLVEESVDFLLNTIKYCTRSTKVCEELGKKVLLNENGRLGLTKNDDLSKDIFYPELFKKNLRLFLNTIFGIDNICTVSDKKSLAECDNISCRDVKEKNIHFFDQYSGLIILYLIRVTVELAHVKKIEI